MSPVLIAGWPAETGIAIVTIWAVAGRLPSLPLAGLAVNYSAGVVIAWIERDRVMVAAYAVVLAGIGITWWRRRKDRRKALSSLGAKGRARIAAMVTAMRERAKPRPVLRPERIPA